MHTSTETEEYTLNWLSASRGWCPSVDIPSNAMEAACAMFFPLERAQLNKAYRDLSTLPEGA